MSAAYAGSTMLMKVYAPDATGGASPCTGTIDLTEGCPMPMLN